MKYTNIYKRIYSLHRDYGQSPDSVFAMSAYIRSHNTMPKNGVQEFANVLKKVAELTSAVAHLAVGEHHSGTTTSDAHPKKTKLERQAHAGAMKLASEHRFAKQLAFISENQGPDGVRAFEKMRNVLIEARLEANKLAEQATTKEEKKKAKNAARKTFKESILLLLGEYKVPDFPLDVTTTHMSASAKTMPYPAPGDHGTSQEAEFNDALWMTRPQGYEMRDSLRYL
jgi:hypothetical protein